MATSLDLPRPSLELQPLAPAGRHFDLAWNSAISTFTPSVGFKLPGWSTGVRSALSSKGFMSASWRTQPIETGIASPGATILKGQCPCLPSSPWPAGPARRMRPDRLRNLAASDHRNCRHVIGDSDDARIAGLRRLRQRVIIQILEMESDFHFAWVPAGSQRLRGDVANGLRGTGLRRRDRQLGCTSRDIRVRFPCRGRPSAAATYGAASLIVPSKISTHALAVNSLREFIEPVSNDLSAGRVKSCLMHRCCLSRCAAMQRFGFPGLAGHRNSG